MRRPRKRRWPLAAAVLSMLAIAVAAVGTWHYRAELATRVAITVLEQQGLGPVQLSVHSLGLRSARATGVTLLGGAVRASAVELGFTANDLADGRIDRIDIEGLRAHVGFDGKSMTVGGKPLPKRSQVDEGRTLGPVTLRNVEITAALPGLASPATITGGGKLVDQRLTFEVVAAVSGAHGSVLELLLAGRHDLTDTSGTASVTMRTLKFHRHSKQPGDLLTALANLPRLDGEARAAGIVTWKDGKIVPDLVVHIDRVAFDTRQASVHGLDADVRIVQFAPLATAAHQTLTAFIKSGSSPPSKVDLRFELLPKPALRVEGLTAAFAGGKVTAAPFTVDPSRVSIDTVLHLNGVELAELFRLIGIDGLAGKGKIAGDVLLRVRGSKVLIDDSHLAATGPGELNISSAWLSDKLGGANETLRQAVEALTDFHYQKLDIVLDRGEAGQGSVLLKLSGENPTSGKGQQYNLNIRLDSNFDRLTELALQALAATHELLRTH